MPLILRGDARLGLRLEDDTRLSPTNDQAPNIAVQAARSVCTLVRRSQLVQSQDQTYFTFQDGTYNSLLSSTRSRIAEDIKTMQEQVAIYFQPHTPTNAAAETAYQAKLAQVKKLNWPDAKTVPLPIKWGDEPVIGFGTGYYIGSNLMATASHCLDESKLERDDASDWARDIYAVFNLVDAKARLPATSVFKLKRLVLKTTKTEVNILNPNLVIDTANLALYQQQYDMAFVEIIPAVANNLQRPPQLIFDTLPTQLGDQVYTVGSPRGIAAKYSFGGQVRRAPSQGSFGVDLDVFHGSSGSPVLNGLRVLGTLSSIYPRDFPTSYSSDQHSDLFHALDRWSANVPRAPPGSKPNPGEIPIQDDFLTSYPSSDCCNYPPDYARGRPDFVISWMRATPQANTTARGGCTTRIDPYGHLFQSLATFDRPNATAPFGQSSIEISIVLSGEQPSTLGSSYSLIVQDDHNNAYSTQQIVRSPKMLDGDLLIFGRHTADNGNPLDAQIMAAPYDLAATHPSHRYALIQSALWNSPSPLSWRTVTIVSNNGWQGNAMPHLEGSNIVLRFDRRAGSAGAVNWPEESFKFQVPIRWDPNGAQGNNWTGFIGDLNRQEGRKNEGWWDGPL